MPALAARIEKTLGARVLSCTPIGGGAGGSVVRIVLADGAALVAKHAPDAVGDGLLLEARSLATLRERSGLPVPGVRHAERDFLVMEHVPGAASLDARAEAHAAELLAALHDVHSPDGRFGLHHDALIGPLHQPNAPCGSWVEFWRDRRLLPFAHDAARAGVMRSDLLRRVEALCGRLAGMIPDRPGASLIHGDVWSGNVLAHAGRVTAFLDPAPYFAHHEAELAFIEMFFTFGTPFSERYAELREPPDRSYRELRRHVYMLYPVLVHVRLFGGGYIGQAHHLLDMLGC
jgi:fructosamine-3-kinase